MSCCISFEARIVSSDRSLVEVSSCCPSSIFWYTLPDASETSMIVLVRSSCCDDTVDETQAALPDA